MNEEIFLESLLREAVKHCEKLSHEDFTPLKLKYMYLISQVIVDLKINQHFLLCQFLLVDATQMFTTQTSLLHKGNLVEYFRRECSLNIINRITSEEPFLFK